MNRRSLLIAAAAAGLRAQPLKPEREVWFSCPMDPGIRSKGPGKCSKCGMALVAAIAEPVAYPLDIEIRPGHVPAAQPLTVTFRVRDPKTGRPVTRFEVVHERLFHQFIVSQSMRFFAHEHPEPQRDGSFRLGVTLPEPGIYRLVSDFYPAGGTPQFLSRTIVTAGYNEPLRPAALEADLQFKRGGNVAVEMRLEPAQPLAGNVTRLFFRLAPAEGLELYLGAWAHLMAISNDLIDAVHAHPEIADGGPVMQFNLIFPRQTSYRVWLQAQRAGIVNTVSFTIPVGGL